MKFGKQFELYKIPEWLEYYFDYKGLKLVLKFLDNRPVKRKKLKALQMIKRNYERKYTLNVPKIQKLNRRVSSITNDSFASIEVPVNTFESKKAKLKRKRIMEAEDLSLLPNEEKLSRFIIMYKEKLKVIDDFFKMKLEEYSSELKNLENKMNLMENPSNDESFVEEINAERDEMGYAVSWKRALSSLYNETSWLHSYHSINSLAVEKIKKKIIKIFKYYNIQTAEILEKTNSEFIFFGNSLDKLINLRVTIKKLYAQKFTKGNALKAKTELEKRLQGTSKESNYHLMCLYLGILFTSIFSYVVIKNINGKNRNDSFKPFFPFFSFSYIIILSLFLLGIDMIILQHYKINYAYIFELDSANKIKPMAIFQHAFGLASLWMLLFLMMKLALKFGLFGGEYTLFPLLMNTFLVIILFLPFHILYLSFRKGILMVLIRNIFPLGKNTVRFKDFVFGDILTSLSDPFKNLLLGYCLMLCQECYVNNSRGPCNKDTIPCLIISVYPQFIRWTQCINKLYYTRLLWPHLGNFFKYTTGIGNTLIGYFYTKKKNHLRLYFRIFIGAASTLYNLFWDIYLDWGCGRKNEQNLFLRETLTYPKIVYYLAIIYDIIVRTTWTWNFIHINQSLSEWKNILTCTLEVIRRAVWVLIRVENENLSNPENYRTILAIPELPME
jgi:hypothetical protein